MPGTHHISRYAILCLSGAIALLRARRRGDARRSEAEAHLLAGRGHGGVERRTMLVIRSACAARPRRILVVTVAEKYLSRRAAGNFGRGALAVSLEA
jgi:hypothetical protein